MIQELVDLGTVREHIELMLNETEERHTAFNLGALAEALAQMGMLDAPWPSAQVAQVEQVVSCEEKDPEELITLEDQVDGAIVHVPRGILQELLENISPDSFGEVGSWRVSCHPTATVLHVFESGKTGAAVPRSTIEELLNG